MSITLWRCVLLPITLLAALCSDTGLISKFVCIGDSIQVFQNITSTSYKGDITLYKTFSGKVEAIAVWFMQNISNVGSIHSKYKQKVSLENGTILIRNFQTSDEATYAIVYDNDFPKIKEVQICALVPPTESCKLNIRLEENVLMASLDDSFSCGKPIATVHWMEYPGIAYISQTILKLQPGNEAGTYRACIDSEALKCVENSTKWDKCGDYTVGSIKATNSPISSSDVSQLKTTGFVIVVMISLVLLIMIVILLKQFRAVDKIPSRVPVELMLNELSCLEEDDTDGKETE